MGNANGLELKCSTLLPLSATCCTLVDPFRGLCRPYWRSKRAFEQNRSPAQCNEVAFQLMYNSRHMQTRVHWALASAQDNRTLEARLGDHEMPCFLAERLRQASGSADLLSWRLQQHTIQCTVPALYTHRQWSH